MFLNSIVKCTEAQITVLQSWQRSLYARS